MARMKGRLFDRNRYNKKYSYVRAPKNYAYIGDKNLEIEVQQVTFNNESSKEISFEFAFADSNYQVSLTPRQPSSSAESAAVNLSVDVHSRTATGFKILASAPFTGEVDVMVVKINAFV